MIIRKMQLCVLFQELIANDCVFNFHPGALIELYDLFCFNH